MSVAIVLTSHSDLGDTGKKTGYFLSEVTHPYFELRNAGFNVDLVSILGGEPPMDESSRDVGDPDNKKFLEDPAFMGLLSKTQPLSEIDPSAYRAILFAGGHGTMWDFPIAPAVSTQARAIYEQGGVVAAVCHGPAALTNIKLTDGRYLIEGKSLTAFTNAEEAAVEVDGIVPFALETRLQELGAKFEGAPLWAEHVVTDERLITGQNPASARELGRQLVNLLKR